FALASTPRRATSAGRPQAENFPSGWTMSLSKSHITRAVVDRLNEIGIGPVYSLSIPRRRDPYTRSLAAQDPRVAHPLLVAQLHLHLVRLLARGERRLHDRAGHRGPAVDRHLVVRTDHDFQQALARRDLFVGAQRRFLRQDRIALGLSRQGDGALRRRRD